MKRRLRICLLFLLSLALPLYGMAGSGLPAEPCPLMMQAPATSVMSAMDMDCHEHVAEDDHPAPHKGGLCDDGHVCKAGSLLQVAVLKPPVVAPLPPQPGFVPAFLPSAANADVWRPPRG